MPKNLTVKLGEIPIQLIPDTLSGRFSFIKPFDNFECACQPELSLDVCCGWFPNQHFGPVAFDTNAAWKLFVDNGKWVYHTREQSPWQLGIFPQDFSSGVIHVAARSENPDRYVFPLDHPMGELLLMNLLGRGRGVMLHACGVVYQGEGYLFTGHGGAGKTTTARLWQNLPGAQIVNDDKVIVRKKDGAYWMYGTPWHGEGGMALPLSAPLKRIFLLNQSTENNARSLSPVLAVSKLLTWGFVPLWDAEKMAFTLDFLGELVQALPCQELGFRKDPSVVDYVLNLS
jgi:hypothetical protein